MAKEKVAVKQNPQLKKRILTGGRIALYLEYYLGRTETPKYDANGLQMHYPAGTKMAGKPMYTVKHERKKEELKLYLIAKPRTPEEKERNKETLLLAEQVRQKREQEMLNDVMGYRVNTHKNDNIFDYFETYLADYTKKDKRNINLAINRFKSFLREYRPLCATKKTAKEIAAIDAEWAEKHKNVHGRHVLNENSYYRFSLKPGQLNSEMVRRFVDYLKANSEGEGASTAYARFKKVLKNAHEQGILKTYPCAGISCQRNDVLTKDVLSPEEVSQLVRTHYPGENPEIRRAFILTLYTGIRFCDIKELTYADVDYANGILSFDQSKTVGHSSASRVSIPLRPDLFRLIGTAKEYGKAKSDRIFNLPSHTMCLKALSRWTTRAGIEKHITWHCGRHSFATNILTGGANIKVVSSLLGHSGLQYVAKYTRALDDAKQKAIDSLPDIEF